MTATVSHRNTCRLCGAKDVRLVLKLQPIPLSEKYATDRATAKAEQRFPVDVYMCDDCGHVQHLDVINASDLWDSYTYFSGEAKGMPEHFAQIAAKIRRTYDPPAGSLVVDIGSNDGSLLKPFKAAGHRVWGIDPAKSVARRAIEAGIPTIAELMTPDLARSIRDQHGPAHVVCAFNVFAHADDLSAMAESIRKSLQSSGRMRAVYDDTGAIGKLYRRQDEIGTPFCLTVDFQSLEDQTVTVRDRDTMAQERVPVAELQSYLEERLV